MKHPKKQFESMDYLSQLRLLANEISYYVKFLEKQDLIFWYTGKRQDEEYICFAIKKQAMKDYEFKWDDDIGIYIQKKTDGG